MEKRKFLLFAMLLLTFLVFCTKLSKTNKIDSQIKLNDSLFIGIPQISDSTFIKNIQNGLITFKSYENVLNTKNKIFSNWEYNKGKTTLGIDNNLTLELKRKKFPKATKTKDIQIMLYTKINNIAKDSVLFYKYQWEKDSPVEQRFETLSYLDNQLNLWHLETYTAQSEDALGIDKYEKYKIDKVTGKIKFIENLKFVF